MGVFAHTLIIINSGLNSRGLQSKYADVHSTVTEIFDLFYIIIIHRVYTVHIRYRNRAVISE